MEIKGKIVQVLQTVSGIGKNGEWKNQQIVVETFGNYPKNVCLKLAKNDMIDKFNIGQFVTFSVEVESREYNGRWYTDVKVWKYDLDNSITHNETPSPSQSQQVEVDFDIPQQAAMSNDLPF